MVSSTSFHLIASFLVNFGVKLHIYLQSLLFSVAITSRLPPPVHYRAAIDRFVCNDRLKLCKKKKKKEPRTTTTTRSILARDRCHINNPPKTSKPSLALSPGPIDPSRLTLSRQHVTPPRHRALRQLRAPCSVAPKSQTGGFNFPLDRHRRPRPRHSLTHSPAHAPAAALSWGPGDDPRVRATRTRARRGRRAT